jgi:hypothetical protein
MRRRSPVSVYDIASHHRIFVLAMPPTAQDAVRVVLWWIDRGLGPAVNNTLTSTASLWSLEELNMETCGVSGSFTRVSGLPRQRVIEAENKGAGLRSWLVALHSLSLVLTLRYRSTGCLGRRPPRSNQY